MDGRVCAEPGLQLPLPIGPLAVTGRGIFQHPGETSTKSTHHWRPCKVQVQIPLSHIVPFQVRHRVQGVALEVSLGAIVGPSGGGARAHP